MNIRYLVFTLLLGITLGWWLHHYWKTVAPPKDSIKVDTLHTAEEFPLGASNVAQQKIPQQNILQEQEILEFSRKHNSPSPTQYRDKYASPSLQETFYALILDGEYEAAMVVYQNASERSEGVELRAWLLVHMNSLVVDKDQGALTELTDVYLTYYFNDVDVLLVLAKSNLYTSYYVDALGFFQLAKEYAYTYQDREKVNQTFQKFLDSAEKDLLQLGDGYSLGQLYLQAEILGMLNVKQRLRHAEIYIANGEPVIARQILLELSGNSEVAPYALNLLESLDASAQREPKQSEEFSDVIELQRRGNQFIAPLQIGDRTTATLLIDTGASITTLSATAFSRMENDIEPRQIGERMFSTANGVIKGTVYEVNRVVLGGFEINNSQIAVLDFAERGGVQGLLGMNVLGKFTFHIDQDQSQLWLSPRK